MIGLDPGGKPTNKAGLLAASFLSGTFGAAFMLLLAWNASNIAGHSKKVTSNALTLIAFCVGNILGTQTFQQKQAPGYISGKISIIATLGALCFVIVALRLYNDHLNRKNKTLLASMSEDEKTQLREKMAFADQTDRHNVFFVYTHWDTILNRTHIFIFQTLRSSSFLLHNSAHEYEKVHLSWCHISTAPFWPIMTTSIVTQVSVVYKLFFPIYNNVQNKHIPPIHFTIFSKCRNLSNRPRSIQKLIPR